MITIVFKDGNNYASADGLWQWDYGQVLRIQGLNLPTAAEIHFSLQETGGEAVTRVGVTKDGVTEVVIPDSMLEGAQSHNYYIYVFVYLADEKKGKTEKKAALSVKARPKPEGFDRPEDAELFREAIAAVNDAAERSETAADQSQTAAEDAAEARLAAENAAIRSDQARQEAQEAARQTKQSCDQAVSSASVAVQAEAEAKGAADQSGKYAASAEASADVANQAAESAEADRLQTESDARATAADRTAVAEDRKAVEDASVTQIESITRTGEEQIRDITASGESQVGNVNQAGADQMQAVEAAAAEIIKERELIRESARELARMAPGIEGTASGRLIQLTDSSEKPFQRMALFGRSDQATTTGAQLFDQSMFDTFLNANRNIRVTNNGDGSFTIAGSGITGSIERNYPKDVTGMLKPGILTFSLGAATIPYFAVSLYIDGQRQFTISNESQRTVSINITEEMLNGSKLEFRFKIYSGSSMEAKPGTVWPMLYQDGDGTWEPYTGGKPSPSPDYPQEIVSAGDEGQIEVRVSGAQLCNGEELEIGGLASGTGLDYETADRIRTGFIPVFSGNVYTISGHTQYNKSNFFQYDSDKKFNGVFYSGVPINESIAFIRASFRKPDGGEFTDSELDALRNTLMVNLGSTALPYEPYKPIQSIILPTPNGLPGIPVTSGGNYTDENGQQWVADEIVVNGDGSGKLHKYVWEKWFDGSENWSGYSTYNGFLCGGILPESMIRRSGFCNQLRVDNEANRKDNGLWLGVQNNVIYVVNITYYDGSLPDKGLANWKAHLAENPLHVMTYLDEPIVTDLTPEQVQALTTYYPNTIITNSAGAHMEAEYIADTKMYIDKKLEPVIQSLLEIKTGGN